MYEKINGIPVQEFCDWYNNKYNGNLTPDNIEFELHYDELSIAADIAEEEIGYKYRPDNWIKL